MSEAQGISTGFISFSAFNVIEGQKPKPPTFEYVPTFNIHKTVNTLGGIDCPSTVGLGNTGYAVFRGLLPAWF